jgi:integrase
MEVVKLIDKKELKEVKKFQQANYQVTKHLNDIGTKYAELVNETPFDKSIELTNRLLQDQIKVLTDLIENNSGITREYIKVTLSPIERGIIELNSKMDLLLPKEKKVYDTQKLRDPIDNKLFPIFLVAAGSLVKYNKELRRSQLRICYSILFHVGLRLNELREIKFKDISDAIETSQLSVIHYKTNQPHIHILSQKAVEDLKNIKNDYDVVFNKHNCEYLFGKTKPMHPKSLIRLVNEDLRNTCKINNIAYNIKSHSFRINMISHLLKVTSVQNAANIIGHQDIRSTMTYKRYALTKAEIQDLLQKIVEGD